MNSIGGCQTRSDVDLVAIVRPVSNTIDQCQLTHLRRDKIDLARAEKQHADYVEVLRACGCHIIQLPPEHECPDAVFVEDTAIVVNEIAVMTRPGAPSRREEVASVRKVLVGYRDIRSIDDGATLDGGDVVRAENRLWVGVSTRTTARGAESLGHCLSSFGYEVAPVQVHNCLHLKSACCALDQETLLYNPAWIDASHFQDMRCIEVDPTEPMAANVVGVGDRLLVAAAHPRTADLLDVAGYQIEIIEADELAKAEGALTCCSIIFRTLNSVSSQMDY